MAVELQRRTVGDYVELQRGTTYEGALVGKPGPALLGLGSIEPGGGFRFGHYKTYGGDCPANLMLLPGDIYAALKGATKDGKMIGSVARVPPVITSGRLTQDTVKLILRSPDPDEASYLYWILRTPQYRAYCEGHAMGSAVVALSRRDFLSFPVPPLIPARKQIVALLEAVDNKIELNRRVSQTLGAMAQALFKSWFVDFDPVRAKIEGRDPRLPNSIAKLFPDDFQDTELGEMPTGWTTSPVYEIATYVNGAAYRDFEPNHERRGLPIVKIAELKSGVTTQTAFSAIEMPDKYRIDTYDILFSWSGNPDTSIDTFEWTNGPAWLNQHIFRVVPPSEDARAFVLMTLRHLRPVFAEIARNKQTTGLGHVTAGDMKGLLVPRPPNNILIRWNSIVEPLLKRAFNLHEECNSLSTLRDLLLSKLISGELQTREV
jgi:type I restriction enzyme S subunit